MDKVRDTFETNVGAEESADLVYWIWLSLAIGAGSSAAFLNGISPNTVLTAGIFLHERITSVQFLSMALVLAGLYFNAANRSFVPVHRKIQN